MILESNKYLNITEKDMEKYDILQKVINKELDNAEAGLMLSLTSRQIRRLKVKILKKGIAGLIHENIGKTSNRRINEEIMNKASDLLKTRYYDFGPTFASEKLEEEYEIVINKETIRLKMIEMGLRGVRHRKTNEEYRNFRERMFHCGEMVQFDGSYHNWFSDGIERCLLVSIDDATGKVIAFFDDSESYICVSSFWKRYCLEYGKPISIYLDRFSTYKVNNNNTMFNDVELKTKFRKVTDRLGIGLITAHSPQAKGRVERQNRTLQDRLVKELRLNNIKTITEANAFLQDIFLPKHNTKFMVIPVSNKDIHRKLNKDEIKNIDNIFSIEETRKVNNDFTISHKSIWYQLEKIQPTLVLRRDTIKVITRLDSSIHLFLRDKELNFKQLPQKPEKANLKRFKETTGLQREEIHRDMARKPVANHPWRNNTGSIIFRERIRISQEQRQEQKYVTNDN